MLSRGTIGKRFAGTVGLVALVLIGAPPAQAAFPGQNGLIAFSSGGNIETMLPDGSGRAVLRRGNDPAWSADGSQIAFVSPDAGSSGGIATMTPDGTLLTTCPCDGANIPIESWSFQYPNWSPDGRISAQESYYGADGEVDTHTPWVFMPGGGSFESKALLATGALTVRASISTGGGATAVATA